MAHTVVTTNTMAEIATAIVGFAGDRGIPTTGNTLTMAGAEPFTVSGLGTSLTVSVTIDSVVRVAEIHQPERKGTENAPVRLAPTRTFLFGGPDWIAAAVEFSFNQFRHIYLGKMERYGDWTGGEIIAANHFSADRPFNQPSGERSAFDIKHHYLFSALTEPLRLDGVPIFHSGTGGGVNIEHADNDEQWRTFFTESGTPDTCVLGGAGDIISSTLVKAGIADYAAGNLLTPITLYAPDSARADRLRPIGHVAGARMIDMRNLDPGQHFFIGADEWVAFPEFGKNGDVTTWGGAGGGFYTSRDTSGMQGLAYPMAV